MPEFIEQNIALFGLIAFIILVAMLIVIIRYSVYMSKFFSNKKFRINSDYVLEPTEENRSFSLTIFNSNVNDARVIAFGFIYKNHSLNYHKAYLKANNFNDNYKVVIPSRDCIAITIDAHELRTIISDINRGKRRVGSLKAFVSDSSGLTIKTNAKAVKRQLQSFFNIEYQEEKRQKAEIRAQLEAEVKAKKDKRKFEQKMARKARIEKYKNKIKKLFTIKKKKDQS
jgi:hypothetical protein